jgi:diguanylate cyclase (GGDEF)-like protein
MSPENPEQYSPEKIEEINKERKKYDKLGKGFKYDLAKEEDSWREKVKEEKEKAFIDSLTGLRARAALDAEIPQMLSQEKRRKGKCCLLMIDIDKFKEINDVYGHLSGDEAIKNVANILKESCRKADVAYRYGGDEFTIFLPDTDIKDVEKIIERIREKLDEANNGKKFNINENVTLSIGMSKVNYLEKEKDKDRLIKEADIALYDVKESGRNGSREYKKGMKEKEKKVMD